MDFMKSSHIHWSNLRWFIKLLPIITSMETPPLSNLDGFIKLSNIPSMQTSPQFNPNRFNKLLSIITSMETLPLFNLNRFNKILLIKTSMETLPLFNLNRFIKLLLNYNLNENSEPRFNLDGWSAISLETFNTYKIFNSSIFHSLEHHQNLK